MKDLNVYKEYASSVHYSEEDEIFYGKLEGIDDLVTFEGQGVPQLENAFHEAVEDYIEIAHETGKSQVNTVG